ncbi:MAG TPA: biotin--[acetyl-CoA-carboxylase] ligase [Vicinamibacterales bacterium]|nr:biotin--[acetyl-CoA-carboxylase] ligase [Vicinamibacterales bacterium]
MSDPLPPALAAGLARTRARRGPFGDPVLYLSETASTNDVASDLAARGAAEGTTVIAGRQLAGRGRLGRSWHSPPGAGLYVSVIVRSAAVYPLLTLAGGVAVADGIRTSTGLPVAIKWPNDVVVPDRRAPAGRRKLAGILAEASSEGGRVSHVVLGFGVNVAPAAFPPDVAAQATSLETELGRPVDIGDVLGETLSALAERVASLVRGERGPLLARWRALAPGASGSRIEWESGGGRFSGVTMGIDDDGALLVRGSAGVERIFSATVVWM